MKAIQEYKSMSLPEIITYTKSAEPKSFQDIIQIKAPSFRMIEQSHGKIGIGELLISELAEICSLLSFKVSGEMIAECAKNIVDEFWDCKLDDIRLFRKYLLTNRLNVEMYRNDALVLFKLFQDYYGQRYQVLEEARLSAHNSEKKEYQQGFAKAYANASDETKKMINDYTAKVEKDIRDKRQKFDEELPERKDEIKIAAKAAKESMEWMTCQHEFVAKLGYSECHKCGSVINDIE